jgi:hypothetical protein
MRSGSRPAPRADAIQESQDLRAPRETAFDRTLAREVELQKPDEDRQQTLSRQHEHREAGDHEDEPEQVPARARDPVEQHRGVRSHRAASRESSPEATARRTRAAAAP